jgi:transcriptional regulator
VSRDRRLTDQEITRYLKAREPFNMLGDVAIKLARELKTSFEVQAAIDALERAVQNIEKIKRKKS